jgi:hypothetical protein
MKPTLDSVQCYVDADFRGNWDPNLADDPITAKSRSGYVINYAELPIIWAFKLQTKILLSTTESGYVAIYTAFREVIPMMHFLKELSDNGFPFNTLVPEIRSTVFEDNDDI